MKPSSAFPVWMVIGTYLAIVAATGAYYSKFMASSQAYFKAGNAVPWWAAGISMYMSNFSAYTFVGIGSLVYREGLTGLLLETGPTLAFLVAAGFFARRWHRLNLISPPEYLEARFNPTTRKVFSMVGISTILLASGLRLYALCKFAEAMMGVPLAPTIIVTGGVIVLYSMLGGLWAVIITDFIQFVVLYLAAFCLMAMTLWIVLVQVGWSAFVAQIPSHFGAFPGPNPRHGWAWLIAFWFGYELDYNGDWGIIQRMCCTPTEGDARKSALVATAFAIPHAFFLLGPCFVARVLFSGTIGDPAATGAAEGAYGHIAALLLPPGLVGIVTAAMLSATMSTLSVGWTVRSASLVNDLYVRFFRPQARDREQILVGRIGLVAIGAIAVLIALFVSSLGAGLFALSQSLIGIIVIPLITPLLGALIILRSKSWAGLGAMGLCLAFAVANKFAPAVIGRSEPLPFEWEVPIEFALGMLAIGFSGLWPRTEREIGREREFKRRLAHPRPAAAADDKLPPPLGVLSAFVLVIAALVAALVLFPQTGSQRALTALAAVLLTAAGVAMRLIHRHLQRSS